MTKALIDFVYPDLIKNFGTNISQNGDYLYDRCVLAPLYKDVKSINSKITAKLPGTLYTSKSIDIPDPDGFDSLPEECLNKISASGLPEHIIDLKVGMPVVITRNMYVSKGVCNGSRMILTEVGTGFIVGRLFSGPFKGNKIMIPKVKLHHKGSDQFPEGQSGEGTKVHGGTAAGSSEPAERRTQRESLEQPVQAEGISSPATGSLSVQKILNSTRRQNLEAAAALLEQKKQAAHTYQEARRTQMSGSNPSGVLSGATTGKGIPLTPNTQKDPPRGQEGNDRETSQASNILEALGDVPGVDTLGCLAEMPPTTQ
ncbi:hypothetical protein PCANC_26754 [Puccinia coronata f. sp. avenae]|uniref:DNA helicase Pif1-like 2B domain-containing protein n=1 Tax=Puccinia coronata f. sp. avenae TaxID=200324 RepID=A0A2N5THY0_9BASI|nr:hypothetical protein PCANC_26754 [Puccinia coronata f. sp. avenae]